MQIEQLEKVAKLEAEASVDKALEDVEQVRAAYIVAIGTFF